MIQQKIKTRRGKKEHNEVPASDFFLYDWVIALVLDTGTHQHKLVVRADKCEQRTWSTNFGLVDHRDKTVIALREKR